jgi:hypothetical protein
VGVKQVGGESVHIAAAIWNRTKRKFQTSVLLPEKFLKTHQMDTAETDETSFGGFVTMLSASFRKFGSTVFD